MPKEDAAIQISSLKGPREEFHCAAREIARLVRVKGYRYREIAIVCGNLPGYVNYAKEVFAEYRIPLFIDQKTTVAYHPFIEFLRAALEVVLHDFSQDGVFRYLRSGLSGILREDVDRLENYCLAAGIRGYRKWKEPFCYLPRGYEEESLSALNETRKKVMDAFEGLYASLKEKGITVEGDYHFYHRVGFRTSAEFGIYPTQGIPLNEPRCMMCQEVYEGALNDINGYVVYDMYYNA